MAIYVGSDLTADGSTMFGGFGHEQSSHWIQIVPRQQFPADATTTVGVTADAEIPGELIEIPQAEETNKYISSFYSQWAGFPAPLTNGGLNEHGLAARDVWSPSRTELVEMAREAAPLRGPQYSDLAKAAMERASTAQEAAEVVGGLMDEDGYSTYGGNSHLFADEDEGWCSSTSPIPRVISGPPSVSARMRFGCPIPATSASSPSITRTTRISWVPRNC